MSVEVPSRRDIAAAADTVSASIRETPVVTLEADDLALSGEPVSLKLEQLQHTGSFKPRGAFNRALTVGEPPAGLIAASGGNHGLAVAHVARSRRVHAEIFVPETVPPIKLSAIRQLGAEVTLAGPTYDDARQACEARAAETGALLIHAYDQPDVMAGAGTVGLEFEKQVPDLDTLLVAVGGGGLIGGMAAWYGPDVRVVGVEPEGCPTMAAALAAGEPVAVQVGGLAVDSLGARELSTHAFASISKHGVEAVLVAEAAIRDAQALLWDRLRIVAEPGGATALAALAAGAYVAQPGERVGVVICGANTDPSTIRR